MNSSLNETILGYLRNNIEIWDSEFPIGPALVTQSSAVNSLRCRSGPCGGKEQPAAPCGTITLCYKYIGPLGKGLLLRGGVRKRENCPI